MKKQLSVDPDLLQANPWNTNVVSPENEAKLDAAIARFGFFKPITVRWLPELEKYEILGGEHRWESAKRLGLAEVPIFNLGDIDEAKAKEISLADNARYGADDTIALAELMGDMGSAEEIQSYLPYSETDIQAIFASVDIALDDLELDPKFDADREKEETASKEPKTHTIMRFKVSLGDAERLTELLAKIQKRQDYSSGDDLTNAGDALVHVVFGAEDPT